MADPDEAPAPAARCGLAGRGRSIGRIAGTALAALATALLLTHAAVAQEPKKKKKKKPKQPPAAASASPSAAPAAGSAPAPAPAAPRRRAALTRIVDSLARDLEQRAPAGALVVAAPLVTDTQAPRATPLVVSFAAQLAGRRGAGAWARSEPANLATAREIARSENGLIYLAVEITNGVVRVTADVYPVPKTVWSRVREPAPGPIAHAFAQAPIDAEIRAFLAPVPLVSASVSVDRAKNFESDVVALACGDLNQDGALEIVSVSRRRVSTVRLRGGKVSPIHSRAWPELVQVNPAPLREPIGFATLVERPVVTDGELGAGAFVDVGLTDRARSVRLDGKLQLAGAFPGLALPDGDSTMCSRNPGLVVTGAVVPCAAADPAPVLPSVGGQYDALASAQLFTRLGEPYVVWAGRERGVLELRDSGGRKQVVDTAGAQLAVGDLDQDGEPEVIASLDVMNPLDDAVVVRSWRRPGDGGKGAAKGKGEEGGGAKPREIMRLPAAAGVRALAVCPPDGPGRAPFVVATTDELWVVR